MTGEPLSDHLGPEHRLWVVETEEHAYPATADPVNGRLVRHDGAYGEYLGDTVHEAHCRDCGVEVDADTVHEADTDLRVCKWCDELVPAVGPNACRGCSARFALDLYDEHTVEG